MRTAAQALEALRALPCGVRLLDALAGTDRAWLVGGAVRDLLLGRAPRELDVVVEGDPAPFAHGLGTVVAHHERFGTFDVADGDCLFDLVRARAEGYSAPGALPDVRPGSLDDDLARRDFTVNAIALSPSGELRSVPGALDDLAAARLRVHHDRSFLDDPTRLWRLVRYAVRLSFLPDAHTTELAARAVRDGALATVSGDRLGAELRLALVEPDPLGTLHAAQNLGLVSGLALEPAVVADAFDLLPAGEGRADLLLLGAVIPDPAWPEPYGFTAAEQRVLARCAALEPLMPDRPSAVVRALRGEPVEAVAVAGARGDARTARRYLHDWRHVRLAIDGNDLIAAGVPEGADLGRRLERVLQARLDGELGDDRDAQLAAALA